MSEWQNPITGKTGGTIIHIGAGQCRELAEYLAEKPARIVLIEPNPQRAQELARRTAEYEHVEVRAVAVTDDPSRTRLQLFNLADLSSLRAPTGAYDLFPGLKITGEIEVEVITTAELFGIGELDAKKNQRLVIDAPGEATAIVNALLTVDHTAHFDQVTLHCGTEPLYEDNAPAVTLLAQLQEAGYDIEQQDDSDPDRPCWSLRCSPLRLENQALRNQIADLQQQMQELAQSRDEQAREAEERAQSLKTLRHEKESLEQKAVDFDKNAKELKEATAREADLTKKVDELEERVRELNRQLEDGHRRQRAMSEEVAKSEAQIELIKELVTHE